MVQPMVWSAAERDGFVEDVQAMRRRVIEHIPAHHAERQLKLGSGGLRDVEFAVQLLQLVHGRADPEIRQPTTLSALAELTRRGYVGREDGEALRDAYAFLRTLEHRIQLFQLRRTHVVPEDEPSLRRLGRRMGFTKEPVATSTASGSTTAARCAGCTRSSSTGRCSPRSPGWPATRPGSRPRRRAGGWRRSASPTRTPRCATSRRSPPASPGPPTSSGSCCRRCSTGSPTRPTRTPGCSASAS